MDFPRPPLLVIRHINFDFRSGDTASPTAEIPDERRTINGARDVRAEKRNVAVQGMRYTKKLDVVRCEHIKNVAGGRYVVYSQDGIFISDGELS